MGRRFLGVLIMVAMTVAPVTAACVISAEMAGGCLLPDCGRDGAGMDREACCCTGSRPSASAHGGSASLALPPETPGFASAGREMPGAACSLSGRPFAHATANRSLHLLNSTFLI